MGLCGCFVLYFGLGGFIVCFPCAFVICRFMTVGVLVGCLCWFTFADFVGGCVVMFCCLLVLGWYLFALMGVLIA